MAPAVFLLTYLEWATWREAIVMVMEAAPRPGASCSLWLFEGRTVAPVVTGLQRLCALAPATKSLSRPCSAHVKGSHPVPHPHHQFGPFASSRKAPVILGSGPGRISWRPGRSLARGGVLSSEDCDIFLLRTLGGGVFLKSHLSTSLVCLKSPGGGPLLGG